MCAGAGGPVGIAPSLTLSSYISPTAAPAASPISATLCGCWRPLTSSSAPRASGRSGECQRRSAWPPARRQPSLPSQRSTACSVPPRTGSSCKAPATTSPIPNASGNLAPGESYSLPSPAASPTRLSTSSRSDMRAATSSQFCTDPSEHDNARAVRLGERTELLVGGRVADRLYHARMKPTTQTITSMRFWGLAGCSGTRTVMLEAPSGHQRALQRLVCAGRRLPGLLGPFTRDDSSRTRCTPGRWWGRRPGPALQQAAGSSAKARARVTGCRAQGRPVMMAWRGIDLCADACCVRPP